MAYSEGDAHNNFLNNAVASSPRTKAEAASASIEASE